MHLKKKIFPTTEEQIIDDNNNNPWLVYSKKKNINNISNKKFNINEKYNDNQKFNDYKKNYYNENEIKSKKKFFSEQTKKEEIKLPSYYQIRNNTNNEIPQHENLWIKKVGGLERAENNESLLKGIIIYSISYYENNNYINKNKFFIGKKTIKNDLEQQNLLELIIIQTTSILFHRAIKSDSVDIIKLILNNTPCYRLITGNPLENSQYYNSNGAYLYLKIKNRWIKLNKNVSNLENNETINEIQNKWMFYILQSIWNGNNPIHDCLYYGSYNSLNFILEFCYKKNLFNILKNLLSISNGQNETHKDIIANGIKYHENQPSFIIRKIQFNKCEGLYNKFIEILDNNIINANNIEENNNLSNHELNSNNNIVEMFLNKDIDSIELYLKNLFQHDKYIIIRKTFETWKNISSNNLLSEFYLSLLTNKNLEQIIKILENDNFDNIINIFKNKNISEVIDKLILLDKNRLNNILIKLKEVSKDDDELLEILEDIRNFDEIKKIIN